MAKHKAKFKFHNGVGELICARCGQIIKEDRFFTDEEWKACRGEIKIPAQYCDICEEQKLLKNE